MKVAVALLVAGAALAAGGIALARTPSQETLIDSTVRFLQESQGADGGFVATGGEASQGVSSWVALALASAGINPLDQSRCGVDAFTFLETHFEAGLKEEIAWPQIATTTFERELLTVEATGTDPHDFAGYDLVGETLARQLPDGSFSYVPGGTGESNDTIFAILALSPIHEARVEAAIAAAREWVVGAENEDGGWFFTGKSPSSEVDMTGAALEALAVAGPPAEGPALAAYEAAERDGLAYLRAAQSPDGGFAAQPREGESNVASTAWATQGIWATGGNPEDWKYGGSGPEPLDYMESMQQPDGHIRWRASSDMNGIWMTAYVVPAFTGQALPVPLAARGSGTATQGEAADCLEAGQGGESPHSGTGVIAGGGGHGAPAFSRPRRGSKGRTPGGARIVHGEGLRARDHSGGDRRGANVEQARGTEDREPRSRAEADQEVDAVSPGSAPEEPVADGASAAAAGGGGKDGKGPGASGEPVEADGPRRDATTTGEDVSGTVIGTPEGSDGKLAFGAPGLKSAGAGSGDGPGLAIAIGAAAALAAFLGAGWERGRRRLA